MDAGVAHVTLEHFCIAEGIAHHRVGRTFRLAEFGNGGNGVFQIKLRCFSVGAFGQFVGDKFAEAVGNVEGELLHARHVL